MAVEMEVVGLDLANDVFQVHGLIVEVQPSGVSDCGDCRVAKFFRHQTPCVIGIEATQGAHYWARVVGALGHEVRLVAPQFVKPHVKSQKNDADHAEAICEAVSRPNMRFVPSKSIEQQDPGVALRHQERVAERRDRR